MELIDKHERGESFAKLAADFGIGIQTVRDIKNNKAKLLDFVKNCDSSAGPSKRKTMKSSTYKELDAALNQWFCQKRADGVIVTGPMCIEKAKFFFGALGLEGNFNASSGWFTRFKQRHGIRELSVQGERLSADNTAAKAFQREFLEFINEENLTPVQIYNADETGLYWKCLPTRTLANQQETRAPGHKASKERLTIMCCGNAAGNHKMKLVMIGKSKKPRSFKGTEAKSLPVHYYHQKAAWMDRDIFSDWFRTKFEIFFIKRGCHKKLF